MFTCYRHEAPAGRAPLFCCLVVKPDRPAQEFVLPSHPVPAYDKTDAYSENTQPQVRTSVHLRYTRLRLPQRFCSESGPRVKAITRVQPPAQPRTGGFQGDLLILAYVLSPRSFNECQYDRSFKSSNSDVRCIALPFFSRALE